MKGFGDRDPGADARVSLGCRSRFVWELVPTHRNLSGDRPRLVAALAVPAICRRLAAFAARAGFHHNGSMPTVASD